VAQEVIEAFLTVASAKGVLLPSLCRRHVPGPFTWEDASYTLEAFIEPLKVCQCSASHQCTRQSIITDTNRTVRVRKYPFEITDRNWLIRPPVKGEKEK
jgi:hypothetical protein